MEYAGVMLVAVAVAVLALAAVRWYRKTHEELAPEPQAPPSLVRMLESEEDLRVAVRRAVAFEQRVADELRTRTRRYEALITPVTPAPVSGIRVHRPMTAARPDPAAARPRSA